MGRWLTLTLILSAIPVAGADDHRASINYTLHCQGCHLADATGLQNEVPRMKDFAGYFLHSPQGREFLIQVPGVATASLPDDELTELMNWLLLTYSSEQLPEPFVPFSVAEVSTLRTRPEASPDKTRTRILESIARDLPSLAAELQQESGR